MRTARHRMALFSLVCVLVGPGAAPAQPPVSAPAESHGTAAPAMEPSGAVVTQAIAADVSVDDSRLLKAGQDQDNWLLHGRTYDNQRFSPLTQISQENVKRLVPVSIIQTGIANSANTTVKKLRSSAPSGNEVIAT